TFHPDISNWYSDDPIDKHFGGKKSALKQDWKGQYIYFHPPHNQINDYLKKANEAVNDTADPIPSRSIGILPDTTEVRQTINHFKATRIITNIPAKYVSYINVHFRPTIATYNCLIVLTQNEAACIDQINKTSLENCMRNELNWDELKIINIPPKFIGNNKRIHSSIAIPRHVQFPEWISLLDWYHPN